MQARQRIVADVLDPGGELDIDVFALEGIAGDDFPAITGEQRDEIALEIDALRQPGEIAGFEALQIGFDSLSAGGLARGIGPDTLGVEPARPHTRRRVPTARGEYRAGHEIGRAHLLRPSHPY